MLINFLDDFQVIVPEPGGFALLGIDIIMIIVYKISSQKYRKYRKNKKGHSRIGTGGISPALKSMRNRGTSLSSMV